MVSHVTPTWLVIVICLVVGGLVFWTVAEVVMETPTAEERAEWANDTYGEGNWTWSTEGCDGSLCLGEPVPRNESVPNASIEWEWNGS